MKIKYISLTLILTLMMGCSFSNHAQPTSKEHPQTSPQEVTHAEKYLYLAYVIKNKTRKWGYIDKTGKFVIKPTYDSAEDFQSNGLAVISINGAYGLIDKTGKLILGPTYEYITNFSNGVATARKNDKTYVLNEKGQVLFHVKDQIYEFKDGLTDFKEGNLYGYMDTSGKVVIKPKFKSANPFNNGNALIQTQDGKYAIIDKTGAITTTLNFDIVRDLSEGTAIYSSNDSKGNKNWGYITLTGEVLIAAKYNYAEPFIDGLAIVNVLNTSQSRYGLINKSGKFIIPPQYVSITRLGGGLYAVATKSLSTPNADFYSKKAIFDKSGKQLTDFKYYYINILPDGLISVNTDTSTLLINKNGEQLKSFPPVDGIGTLKIQGDLVQANIDDDIFYLTRNGKIFWKCPEYIIKLANGIEVKSLKCRPDRCMRIYYPEVSGIADKNVQNKINEILKQEFVGDNPESYKEDDMYVQEVNISFEIENNKDLLIVQKKGYVDSIRTPDSKPQQAFYHININNGKAYRLSNLFKNDSGYLKKLSDIIRKQEDSTSSSDAIEDISDYTDFSITKDRLQIYYTPYAIEAYGRCFPLFDIPYDEIIDIIDTEGDFWKSFDKNITKAPT